MVKMVKYLSNRWALRVMTGLLGPRPVQDLAWCGLDLHPATAVNPAAHLHSSDAFGSIIAGGTAATPRLVAQGRTSPKQLGHRLGGGALAATSGRIAITGGLGGGFKSPQAPHASRCCFCEQSSKSPILLECDQGPTLQYSLTPIGPVEQQPH